jgi:hypothetical protein
MEKSSLAQKLQLLLADQSDLVNLIEMELPSIQSGFDVRQPCAFFGGVAHLLFYLFC